MFVLLEHDTTTAAGVPPAECGVHWDLLIEVPGGERLPTWRLSRSPLDTTDDIPASRIGDHRRLYLEFEGEVGGERGRVRRLDRGEALLEQFSNNQVVVEFRGARLRGTYELVGASPERTVFRRVPQLGSAPGGGPCGRTQT